MERHHLDAELAALEEQILAMGELVAGRLHDAVEALVARDAAAARRLATTDRLVNQYHIAIDERCLRLLATQGPMAIDLRLVTGAMKINTDLERIGDQSVNVAQSALRLSDLAPVKPLIDIPRMAGIAEEMTRDALQSFVRRDAALARAVLRRDDEVDSLKAQVVRELLTFMIADPKLIDRGLSLILISRNLERIADHATNIAEDVIFIAEAKDVRHNRESEETVPS